MDELVLTAEPRKIVGKQTRALRRSGYVPAVLYGPSHEAMNLQVEAHHLRRVLTHAGETRLITVKIDGDSFPALARGIQRHPIKGDFVHVDLYAVDIHKMITTSVPLLLDGEPEIVRNGQALLSHTMNEIEIECLPTDLPPAVRVDVSGLKEIGDAIHVRDLKVLPGVTYLGEPDELIVKISPLAAQPVEPVAEAVEVSAEVEVIKKGKAAEEEGEAAEEPKEAKGGKEGKGKE